MAIASIRLTALFLHKTDNQTFWQETMDFPTLPLSPLESHASSSNREKMKDLNGSYALACKTT
jgi:hypothetical protein